uniref:WAS/WASL interacting protein family, member 2b n=1 Tax=Labrus bergylta TaxID=56723 RepID=A0A3Q3GK73_9LABR
MPIPPPPPHLQEDPTSPHLQPGNTANTSPPKLSKEETKGRGALLSDICNGTRLKKVAVVNDRSAPMLDKPKGGGAATGGANGSAAGSPSGSVPPIGGLFTGGVPKLRPVGGKATPPPPPLPLLLSVAVETPPLLPPLPLLTTERSPSPQPLTTLLPLPSKPPPSPGNSRRPPTSGGNPGASSTSSTLAPPPPPYRISNGPTCGSGEAAPELPQRHNSLGNKRTAPSPGGHTPTRGPAPPPPPASPTPSQQGANRPPPPIRDVPGRGAAPPVPAQPSASRAGGREAPLPPPYRTHGSPSLSSDPPVRGKPPPPPTRTPAAPPPPPPPIRNGHSSSTTSSSIPRSFVDDFESKYSFHPLDDFPPPDEYRHFAKIYPSKANRGTHREQCYITTVL